MKTFRYLCLQALFLLHYSFTYAEYSTGFYLPDSIREISLRFRTYRNLMILPVTLNDSIHLNLILDTGTRNLVVFGRQFENLLLNDFSKNIQFSGLGQGKPVQGYISLNNNLSIGAVEGKNICIVVVQDKNLFGNMPDVHGVIGYEMFLKLEIEINPFNKTITFRSALNPKNLEEYTKIPLEIEDSRPLIATTILYRGTKYKRNVMIDTGSSTGLIMQIDEKEMMETPEENIGLGFNGAFDGYQTASRLAHPFFENRAIPTVIISTANKKTYASLGMDVLRNYIIVLNYCKSYIGLKKKQQAITRSKRKKQSKELIEYENNYALNN